MNLSIDVFGERFKKIQEKISMSLELNNEEMHILLIAHLMEEERNEFSSKIS